MLEIYVDADACPVKTEVLKVAKRYELNVTFVANSWMRYPEDARTKLMVVDGGFDAADDWIVARLTPEDIVVTTDIPLAHRSVKAGAQVLTPTGRHYSEVNIAEAMATRDLMSQLREAGTVSGGPAPFQAQDRSQFLQTLDQIIQNIKRAKQ